MCFIEIPVKILLVQETIAWYVFLFHAQHYQNTTQQYSSVQLKIVQN